MKCPHCGFANKEGEEVCSSCGKLLEPLDNMINSDEEPESEETYGAIYHLESKDDQEEDEEVSEDEEELGIKDASYSKDWRKELKQRVKAIKDKKKKEEAVSGEDSELEEEIDEAELEKTEEEKEVAALEELQPEVKPKVTPSKKARKKPTTKKKIAKKKEPTLFSMDDEEPVSPEEKDIPLRDSQPLKEEIEEKAYPEDLKKLVEDYEPLDEEVFEEPLREEVEERTEMASEMDVSDKEIIVKSRFFAGIFDIMILAIFYLSIVFSTIKIMGTDYLILLKSAPLPLAGLLLLLSMAYFVYFTGFSGQTIGKMALKIRVISVANGRVSFPMSFLRWVGYLISAGAIFLGFLWITFDHEARGWHDKIAGTRVEIYY